MALADVLVCGFQPHEGPVRCMAFDATKVITGGKAWALCLCFCSWFSCLPLTVAKQLTYNDFA
jgi:hypothetical protein